MPVVPVNINIPDPKPDPLLKGLVKEFASIARELRGLKPQAQSSDHADMMKGMMRQQDALLKTIERMMATMAKLPKAQAQSLDLKGMKSAFSGIAEDIKDAIKSSYKPAKAPQVTVNPEVKVNLGGLNKRLSGIEDALVTNSKRGRNRTFGSNF